MIVMSAFLFILASPTYKFNYLYPIHVGENKINRQIDTTWIHRAGAVYLLIVQGING